jgi:hypothetical protein
MDDLIEIEREWKAAIENEGGHFIADGIVCPERWEDAPRKILFVLRETNDSRGDVREGIRRSETEKKTGWRGGRSKVLARVGCWAYGLLNYDGVIPLYEEARSHQFEAPLSTAYINVKKTTGKARSNPKQIDDHVTRYAELLRRQILAIKPEIVVLCGTHGVIKKRIFPQMTRTSERVHYAEGITFLDVYHPSYYRIKGLKLYGQALDAYHQHQISPPVS